MCVCLFYSVVVSLSLLCCVLCVVMLQLYYCFFVCLSAGPCTNYGPDSHRGPEQCTSERPFDSKSATAKVRETTENEAV